MRNILLLLSSFILFSCTSSEKNKPVDSLKHWILDNQRQIDLTCDSIIYDYHKKNKTDSNWKSAEIVITKYASNVLGELAAKAGDSTDCIVIALSFNKDPKHKKQILIAATDSSCFSKLNKSLFPLDSADNFTFGVRKEPLN